MTKLNKKTSKNSTVSPSTLPPTHQIFKLEVNHKCSVEVTREQYNEFLDRGLAIKHKEKLIKNLDGSTYHEAIIIRIVSNLYNKIKAYRKFGHVALEIMAEYKEKLIFCWHYISSSAILMRRAPCN